MFGLEDVPQGVDAKIVPSILNMASLWTAGPHASYIEAPLSLLAPVTI